MNYGELQAAIAEWMHRSDLSSVIPTWVTFATAAFNRELRVPQMEARDVPTAAITGEFRAVPLDFLEIRSIKDQNNRELRFLGAQQFASVVSMGANIDPPIYTIEDLQFRFYPAPTAANPLTPTILYYESIPALTTSTSTNWLLTSDPDLYLYGALKHARAWAEDDARIATAAALYADGLAALKRRKTHATGIASAVGSDMPMRSSSVFDINSGT